MHEDDPYRRAPASTAGGIPNPYGEERGRGPQGRRGWLIVAAVMLGLSALLSAVGVGLIGYEYAFGRYSLGLYDSILVRALADAALLALSITALALFWRKSPWFPRVFAAWTVVATAARAVGPLMMARTGEMSVIMALMIPLAWGLFWYGPWLIYIVSSRRVRNTFAPR